METATDIQHFRFFDNREKYLLFVTTCSEKWVVADRVGMEFRHLRPTPPALRVFDAGMGDATVLSQVMRQLHHRFPTIPFLVVGKEVSLEDVRISLGRMGDRFFEHPQTVLVVTNMFYSEAPRLHPRNPAMQEKLNWWDVPLQGTTAYEFNQQINELQSYLREGWQATTSKRTGNPMYVTPSVLILYRADHQFVLGPIIPQPGQQDHHYDLVIASQPFRARLPAALKVRNVLAPLARSLAPGGRLVTVQSTGRDPRHGDHPRRVAGRRPPSVPRAVFCSRSCKPNCRTASRTCVTIPTARRVPSSTTSCTPSPGKSPTTSAPPPFSPPGTPPFTSPRSRTTSCSRP